MKLKSLKLRGFKSFYDNTTIQFNEGVTAIVGPNGSGKSNISDAVRWVLGEQSSSKLRVKTMDELIFSGTQNKRALSFAEVILTIDNSDHSLKLDYDEVRVTRRIYRSGESEYLINDNKCRLKDIRELFLDTGIGKDGYSMIGQGRVDDILSGDSSLRRNMLDEASGISKYKLRRKDAQKSLEKSKQNLIRINDILREISKQKHPLEKQAKKAHKYLNLRDDLKKIDLAYLYYIIENQEKYQEELANSIQENTKNIDLAEQEKAEIIKSSAQHQENLQLSNKNLNSLNDNLDELNAKINQHENNINLAKQELKAIVARQEDKSEDKLQADLLSLKTDTSNEEENLNRFKLKSDKSSAELDEIKQSIEKVRTKRKELETAENKAKAKLSSLNRRAQANLDILNNEGTNQEVLKKHKDLLLKELANLKEDFAKTSNEKKDLSDKLEALNSKIKDLQADIAAKTEKVNDLDINLDNKNNILSSLNNEINTYIYQIKTQEDLESSYQGYNYAVKNLMNHIDKSRSDVYGPLASLLNVSAQYTQAISTALAGQSQNIVVSDEETAKEMINLLKTRRMGRATFLPLNRLNPYGINESKLNLIRNHPGFMGIASDLVKYDPQVKAAVDYSLGRTVVANNLDAAVDMAKKTGFKLRIVSLDGDLINPGGAMTGGSMNKNDRNSSLLARKNLISNLNTKVKNKKKEASELKEDIASTENELETLDAENQELKLNLDKLKEEALSLNLSKKQNEKEYTKLDSQIAQYETDIKHISEEAKKTKSDLLQYEQEKQDINKEITETETKLDEISADLAEVRTKENELLENKASINADYVKYKEQVNSVEILLRRLANQKQNLENQIKNKRANLNRDQERKVQLEANIKRLNQEIAKLNEEKEEVKAKLDKTKENIETAQEGIKESSDSLSTVSSYLSKLGQEKGSLEQKAENLSKDIMQKRSRLWEEYQLTFAEKDEWYQEDLDVAKAKDEIKSLRRQIKKLGQVNVNAIEASKAVNARYEETTKQKEDIEAAIADLEELIEFLSDKMRKQFAKSFKFINLNFNEVFKELFKGGSAELKLSDENDILNSDIDISASPPGKRVQNINTLSGGERSLTAIALIFAIQKLQPSPFVILDEIEAALDEANIQRFADYIKRHSKETQYILVTHRRGTMEAASTIYGVSMPERGVSTVISLELENVEEEE